MSKFRRVFTGDAEQLRKALIEHFKHLEAEMQRTGNPRGTDYATGLHVGEQHGYREAWHFIRTVEIAEIVEEPVGVRRHKDWLEDKAVRGS